MAIIPAKTFLAGDPLPASDLNTYVSGILTSLMNPPSCKAYRTTTQSVASATMTAISFDAEYWDTDSMHSPTTNPTRVTVPIAGVYLVTWGARYGPISVTNQLMLTRVHRNGLLVDETLWHGLTSTNAYTEGTGAVQLKCNANDYLELIFYHNQGSAVNVDTGFPPSLAVTWLGNG